MIFRQSILTALTLVILLPVNMPSLASGQDTPVDFSADSLQHDDKAGTVTAHGHVELEQGGRVLKADDVIYTIATDSVTAKGNVTLREVSGDIHSADEVQVTDQMREGYIKTLKTTLHDGSRFWAARGHRENGETTTMEDAGYTPCEPCKNHPDSEPAWKITADEVTHDQRDQSISYRNAKMEMWGVPVLYTPYFSHPDGSVKQKSGFLTPNFGYKSDLGFMFGNSYYMALSPHYDATLGMTLMGKQSPLISGEYRHRFENAKFQTSGSITDASRTDSQAGEDVKKGNELRGHIFADGLWDINDKWRAGLGVEFASDDQYLRQYDFSSKDVLENQIYAERFSGRNYAVGRILTFQDVRILEERRDQPDVLPELQASFLGDPGQMLGGRWSVDVSMLDLRREAGGQDMNRAVLQAGWERRFVSDGGLVTTADLDVRGDAYHVRDRDVALTGSGRSGQGSEVRGFARGHLVTAYPVVQAMEKAQIVIEPIASLTVSPDINAGSDNIPNEDSQDVQLDASNLFEPDRFPGLDRIEDQSHVTYGIRTGIYGYGSSKSEVFLGQSYRLNGGINPFPDGSGLSERRSDLVGQITASYKNRFGLDYRFQLDQNDFSPRRHEVNANVKMGRIEIGSRYLSARALQGTTLDENREQVQGAVSYQVSDAWHLKSSVIQDLGKDPGMRKASLGIDYEGQCMGLSGTLRRNLARDSSGESNTEVLFRVGLKNIGDFSTSAIPLDSVKQNQERQDESQ